VSLNFQRTHGGSGNGDVSPLVTGVTVPDTHDDRVWIDALFTPTLYRLIKSTLQDWQGPDEWRWPGPPVARLLHGPMHMGGYVLLFGGLGS